MLRRLLVLPRLLILLLLMPLLWAPTARAADPKPGAAAPATAPSGTVYMRSATAAAMFLAEINKLALQKTQSDAVRALAEKVVRDQEKILAGLARQEAAATTDVKPDAATLARHDEMLTRLRAAAPAQFDQVFFTIEMKSLEDAVQLHESYANAGGDASLKALAAEAAPLLQQRLADAAKVLRDLGTQT